MSCNDMSALSKRDNKEKQRIALVRAFLKKNEFYILDESTSNLDFATENIILDMISINLEINLC